MSACRCFLCFLFFVQIGRPAGTKKGPKTKNHSVYTGVVGVLSGREREREREAGSRRDRAGGGREAEAGSGRERGRGGMGGREGGASSLLS